MRKEGKTEERIEGKKSSITGIMACGVLSLPFLYFASIVDSLLHFTVPSVLESLSEGDIYDDISKTISSQT